MSELDKILKDADSHLDEGLERLFELLRIPSISTDHAFAADCRRAAEWLSADLAASGFDSSVRETEGHPAVVAHDLKSEGAHVLFYGHYDVQPVDPLDLWVTPPFEPAVVLGPHGDKRIVGRGTSDDKGQVMTFLEACRAFRRVRGSLPLKVSIFLEGEEESGSRSLPAFLDTVRSELKADIALVCDTDMWDPQTPAIVTMLRGLVADEFEIRAANKDLHSGMYGSAARNPIQVISEIIASLRADDGSVAVAGFYDDVKEVAPDVATRWKTLGFSEKEFLGSVGLSLPAGERKRSALEQTWSRPTCEINGIWGGYIGEGAKTVIPSKARAKVTFRLVADMDPDKVREAFRAHVRARVPADCAVTFYGGSSTPAVAVPSDGPWVRKAMDALKGEWGRDTVLIGSGGSIPVVTEFKKRLGLDTLLIGFAGHDDQVHSPNEKYDLKSFQGGIRSWIRVLDALARP